MADHVFERLAIIKTIHDYTEPSLVFADQFDTAVLDLVVIDDKSPYFCCGQHSQRESEKVLDTALSYECESGIVGDQRLLIVGLENYFEIRDDHGTLKRGDVP